MDLAEWHRCKRWDFIKGPCPMSILKEHEEEKKRGKEKSGKKEQAKRRSFEQEQPEPEEHGWAWPFDWTDIGAFEKKGRGIGPGDVISAAETVVSEYIEIEIDLRHPEWAKKGAEVGSWGLEFLERLPGPGLSGLDRRALFALAVQGALLGGATLLQATTPGKLLKGAQVLEPVLVQVFKLLSTMQGKSPGGRGFREMYSAGLSALSGG